MTAPDTELVRVIGDEGPPTLLTMNRPRMCDGLSTKLENVIFRFKPSYFVFWNLLLGRGLVIEYSVEWERIGTGVLMCA